MRWVIKKCILILICVYVPYGPAMLNPISLCRKAFTKKATFLAHHTFAHPVAKTLIHSYWTAQHLKFFQNTTQTKELEKGLTQMVRILEDPHIALRLKNLRLPVIIEKLPSMIELAREVTPEQRPYFQQSVVTVLVVIGKLLPRAIQETGPVHWNRLHTILTEVANFDTKDKQDSYFAIYKINRAIERWYSIKELTLCKF